MKMAASPEPKITDDPRVRDPVIANRIRLMVEHEATHQAWGCCLYRLWRVGRISNEQKEAGDEYQRIVESHKHFQTIDPDEVRPEARDFLLRRIGRAKTKWATAVDRLGLGRKAVDRLIFEEIWPNEHEGRMIRDGLQLLANIFGRGTK